MELLVNMKLNWNKNLFFFVRRRKKKYIVGHDIYSVYRSNGKFLILDGLCIALKSTRHYLLTSSISIRKANSDMDIYYVNFPIYLAGAFYFKITGLTYGFTINCSKLVNIRLKK